MNAFFAVVARDLRLAFRRKAEVLSGLFFFVVVAALFPLAIGPEAVTLRHIGPGVLWVGALLASMLTLARLQLSKARLWVLDEPFVALDTLAVHALQQVLRNHLQQDGLLLFTSHQAVDLGSAVLPWRLGR